MNVDCGEILRFYDGKSIFYLLSNILDILVKNKMSIVFYILLPIVKSVFVEFIFNVLLYCDFELEWLFIPILHENKHNEIYNLVLLNSFWVMPKAMKNVNNWKSFKWNALYLI